MNIFLTGTDTEIGKTFVTAGLAVTMQSLGYSTCVYKPVQSGAVGEIGSLQAPDLLYVNNLDPYVKTRATYLLKEPLAPSVAAEIDKVVIDKNAIVNDYNELVKTSECTIVEGAGGMMVPVAPKLIMTDIAKALKLPVLIVVRPDLGTVNHTLLTINHAISSGLKVRGVIINNYPSNTTDLAIKSAPRLIEEYSDTKVLGILKHFDTPPNAQELIANVLNGIDIESVFNVKIAKLDI